MALSFEDVTVLLATGLVLLPKWWSFPVTPNQNGTRGGQENVKLLAKHGGLCNFFITEHCKRPSSQALFKRIGKPSPHVAHTNQIKLLAINDVIKVFNIFGEPQRGLRLTRETFSQHSEGNYRGV